MKNTFPYVFIDEGQDLSLAEYLLIRSINRNAVFNIYGDMDQRISDYSIGSWEELNTVGNFAKYTINENYRNTMQITEFVNDELFMSMVGMGLEGVDVDLQPSSQIAKERQIASLGDRKAIIQLLSDLRRLMFPAYFGDSALMALAPNFQNWRSLSRLRNRHVKKNTSTAMSLYRAFPKRDTMRSSI